MSAMTLPAFNPFTFANRLKSAGVPDKQAEAEAEALHEALAQQAQAVSDLESHVKTLAADTKRDAGQMATKGDLREVRDEMATKQDLREVRDEMATKQDLREVRTEIKGDIKLLYWMLGTLIGLATAALTGVGALLLKVYA